MGIGDSDRQPLDGLLTNERPNKRFGDYRVVRWFLLRGKRLSVAVALLVGILLFLLVMSKIRTLDMYTLLTDTNTIQTLFNSLLSGSILLVSIVVSINSIVLSQEITDIENQRDRIDASVKYRTRIEGFIESDVSPARPADFLRVILHLIEQQVEAIANIAAETGDEQFQEEAQEFADQVKAETDHAGGTLGDTHFGTFKVLLAGLNYDYSWQLHVARRFERTYGHLLDDDQMAAIDDLIETLKFFAIGREYFKSLYYKREFARLSSRLLYVSLPTIVFTSYVLLAMDARLFPEMSILGVSPLLLFVSLAYTIALSPYVILTSYVIRAMTVTLHTLAAGPFILQRGAEMDEFDWDDSIETPEWDVGGAEKRGADD